MDYVDGISFDVQVLEETFPNQFKSVLIPKDMHIQPFIDKRNFNLNFNGIELKVTTADDVRYHF